MYFKRMQQPTWIDHTTLEDGKEMHESLLTKQYPEDWNFPLREVQWERSSAALQSVLPLMTEE